MPTPPEKDSIYGSSKNTNEYKVHLIFLYQANPETGIPYGHFNFLVPAEKEVAQAEAVKPAGSSSSLTEKNKGKKIKKIVIVDKMPQERHTTRENTNAFFATWSGSSKPLPPLPPPSDTPSENESQQHPTGDLQRGDQPEHQGGQTVAEKAQQHPTGDLQRGDQPEHQGGFSSQESGDDDEDENGNEYTKVKGIVERIKNFKSQHPHFEWDWESGSSESDEDDHLLSSAQKSTSNDNIDSNSVSESTSGLVRSDCMGANGSTKGKDHLAEAAAAGPAQPPQPAQPAQEHDDGAHMVSVLRMAGVDVERIFAKKTKQQVVMQWSNKKLLGEVYIANGNSAAVVGKAEVYGQKRISNFAELRGLEWFKNASRELRQAWKNRLLNDEKPLFVWDVECVHHFDNPYKIQGRMNARSFDIDLKRLKSWNDAQDLPGLDLKETALYFLHLLSEEDLARLEKTMKILDGCEIKVGTACSGTDIAVSVTKATFAALSEYFGVPYLKHVLFATYTIYI
jgi:hypothetical protein